MMPSPNFSFCRTPSLEAVRAWRKQTPPEFLFAWKASKFITHWKRLNAETCGNSVDLIGGFGSSPSFDLHVLPGEEWGAYKKLLDFLLQLIGCSPRLRPPVGSKTPGKIDLGAAEMTAELIGAPAFAQRRAVLDNLIARGLKKPELAIVDGAAGLEKAPVTL
jgi:Protein of unknown function DUF72